MQNMIKIIEKYFPEWLELSLITLLYTLSNIWLLLNRGMYWDDQTWLTLIKLNKWQTFWLTTEQQKQYAQYYLMKFLALLGDVHLLSRFIAFFCWLIAALAIYLILKRIFKIASLTSFLITALFALSPLFFERIISAIVLYSISNALFFLGALIYWSAASMERWYVRNTGIALASVFFFVSFFTNSYLVFFFGFVILAIFHDRSLITQWRKKLLWMIFLPVLFWFIKQTGGDPYGLTANYNQFIFGQPGWIPKMIADLWSGIYCGLIWPLTVPWALLERKIFMIVFIAALGCSWLAVHVVARYRSNEKKNGAYSTEGITEYRTYLWWGLILFALGLIAYVLVGKSPHPHPFQMRHAMLLPIGASLIYWSVLMLVVKEKFRAFIVSVICALFITWSTYNYFTLDMDWYKQRSIITRLREQSVQLTARPTLIVFYDEIRQFGWMNRPLTLSDYFGNVTTALGTTTTIGIPAEEEQTARDIFALREWMTGNPVPKSKPNIIHLSIVSQSDKKDLVTVRNWLWMKKTELFGTEKEFEKLLDETFDIHLIPRKMSEKSLWDIEIEKEYK